MQSVKQPCSSYGDELCTCDNEAILKVFARILKTADLNCVLLGK
jgi:hypothetical protein